MKVQETGNLPYRITLTIGYPYMLTTNIDVKDGLTNGTIGILRHIEHCPNVRNKGDFLRVWLEIYPDHLGSLRRIKYRAHIRGKPGVLDEKWVPIELYTRKIKVTKNINCHRSQLPIMPACALTIHK